MSVLPHAIQSAISTFESLAALEEPLTRAAQMVEAALLGGKKLLVCGNGGSAADGADFSTEFACRFLTDRRPYPAMNLSLGGSLITAIGNDYSFEDVFSRQVWAFGQPGDVLVCVTTSGNSKNIIRAIEEAKKRGLKTLALLGKDGGATKGLADVELLVPQYTTARIQEAHKFLFHVLCEMIEGNLKRE